MKKQIEGNIVDLYNRKIYSGIVIIENGVITSFTENDKEYDHYIIPGFIDAHVHIESSMLTPIEFSKIAIARGTVAIVNDPHEIANILGREGIEFMIDDSKASLIKMFFTIPSCVPATSFDYSGGEILARDVEELLESNRFIGLSEMMNIPGVLYNDHETIQKLRMTCKRNLVVDGHAPGLTGTDLKKYIDHGISTDHECTTLKEALEKIRLGMKILIREGSAAKNYDSLKHLIHTHSDQVMFCTDDSHPGDIIHKGHIDKIVIKAIADGFNVFDVLKVASINPVNHYHLNVGTLRSGDRADFTIVDNLKDFTVLSVYIDGIEKYSKGNFDPDPILSIADYSCLNKFGRIPIKTSELIHGVQNEIVAIEVSDGEIVTKKKIFPLFSEFNSFESDSNQDILKLVYLNRYRNDPPQIAYIHGIGLKRGAFATSISHDSHNIIAVGCNDDDLALAINTVITEKGALVVVDGEDIMTLPLPIAGIMTNKTGVEVADVWDNLIHKLKRMGCQLSSPFMTLSFMALIVIPELKIGEKGLFEYSKFNFISEC